MEKRLLDALNLTLRNFANSNLVKDSATVDALGMCLSTFLTMGMAYCV